MTSSSITSSMTGGDVASPAALHKIIRLSKQQCLMEDFLSMTSGLQLDQSKLKCEDALDAFKAKQAQDLKDFGQSIRFSQRQFLEYTRLLVIHEKSKWQDFCDKLAQKLKTLNRMQMDICGQEIGCFLSMEENVIVDNLEILEKL